MSDDAAPNGSKKPRFDPVLNYGHVLTAMTIAVGIAIGIVQFRDSVSELKAEQRLLDARIDNVVKDVTRSQSEEQNFRTEVRSTLTIMTGGIADLRVQVERAGKAPGR